MKINQGPAQPTYSSPTYRPAVKSTRPSSTSEQPASEQAPTDSVSISSEAKLRGVIAETAQQIPADRAAMLAELRNQLRDGSYSVDDHHLAAQLAHHIDFTA